MDKREAIQILKEELLSERDNDSRYPCVSSPRHYEALDLAIEALQDDWIPVSERLPDPCTDVSDFVIAWKPLPEPYKEK